MAHANPSDRADPPPLLPSLDQALADRLDPADRRALRERLARATWRVGAGSPLLVSDGVPIGRRLPHGSVALYRSDPSAPLALRLLDVDRQGDSTAALARGPDGRLREAWLALPDDSAVGVLPGGAEHPLWGASDRLVHAPVGGAASTVTLAAAVRWQAVDLIPAVAEPGRLPASAGSALINLLAALAEDQGRSVLRYRGPYPTEQLFWSLAESFALAADADALARFLAGAEQTFAHGESVEVPVDWRPAPHERRSSADGVAVQLRDGVERVAWRGRSYHRTEIGGLRRREHRVVRPVVTSKGARRYVASLEALGVVVEDHLTLDEHGDVLGRHAPGADPLGVAPFEPPWRDALGALLPLEATPLLAGAIEAVWPGIALTWEPVDGDLVDARRELLRVSPKVARVYRAAHAAADAGARRALAQRLVREILGLLGPAVRATATAWLEAMPPARQAAELDAAAGRDRGALARDALAPLGRLLDALERGQGLPD
jgi:hypothetical protein